MEFAVEAQALLNVSLGRRGGISMLEIDQSASVRVAGNEILKGLSSRKSWRSACHYGAERFRQKHARPGVSQDMRITKSSSKVSVLV